MVAADSVDRHGRRERAACGLTGPKMRGRFDSYDIFSKAKYGDMQAFVLKLKEMGYEEVEIIDTTKGLFMTSWEATWMALKGSAILKGRK